MTALLFRLLGGLTFVAGLAWSVVVLAAPTGVAGSSVAATGMLIGKMMAVAPGIGLVISGLLLIAVGEALWQLDRIARHAAKIVHNTADMAKAREKPKPSKDAASTFNDAVQLFQAKTGAGEPGAAIRELASDALRAQGYLR